MRQSAKEYAEGDCEGSEHGSDKEDVAEAASATKRGPALRDAENYCYFGPAERIRALLDVEEYKKVVPLCPVEELYASSVQHPEHPDWRWLLHVRRVPVISPSGEGASGAAQPAEDVRQTGVTGNTIFFAQPNSDVPCM